MIFCSYCISNLSMHLVSFSISYILKLKTIICVRSTELEKIKTVNMCSVTVFAKYLSHTYNYNIII